MDHSQAFPHSRTTAARPDRSHSLAASGYTSWDAISESLLRARADARAPSARSVRSQRTQDSRHGLQNAHLRGPASESGTSLASSGTVSSRYSSRLVSSKHAHGRSEDRDERQKSARSRTSDSAFRRGARFLQKSEILRPYALVLTLLGIVLVKWCVGLGGYSGELCRALFPVERNARRLTSLVGIDRPSCLAPARGSRSTTPLDRPYVIVAERLDLSTPPSVSCDASRSAAMVLLRPFVLGSRLPSSHRVPLALPWILRPPLAQHGPIRHSSTSGDVLRH